MAHIPAAKPLLEDQGEVYLYTRPFPQQASRLGFTLEKLEAVRDDGSRFPISLKLTEIQGADMARQRFLASGTLPPGNYTGLAFGVKRAVLRGEEGDAALLVAPDAGRTEAFFTVFRGKALFLSLGFNFRDAVTNGFAFRPAFTVTAPGRQVTGLTGYAANTGANTVTVFDRQAFEVTGVIAAGRAPRCIVIDQLRRRAYVALSGDNAVAVIDIATNDTVGTIHLANGDEPVELALSSDGKSLLSVNSGSGSVSFLDPAALVELERVVVGNGPSSIALDPEGARAFVFNETTATISVIDVRNRSLITTIGTGPGPSRGAFNRRGDLLYIIHGQSADLDYLNPFSLSLLNRRHVGMGMQALRVDRVTDLLYAARRLSPEIELFEPSTGLPLTFIRTGGETVHMAIDGELNNLYAVNPSRKSVQVINLVSRNVIAELDLDEDPAWVALVGER
jgi:YVTN family beta-propeller protein